MISSYWLIPEKWAGQPLKLELGEFDKKENKHTIGDQDDTYWNGIRIGGKGNS